MTEEEAAQLIVKCNQTSSLSNEEKWQWMPGMVMLDGIGNVRRITDTDDIDTLLFYAHGLHGGVVPDFTDSITVFATLFLVRRAWIGYEVDIDFLVDGNVNFWIIQENHIKVPFYVKNVPFYHALTLALQKAPIK